MCDASEDGGRSGGRPAPIKTWIVTRAPRQEPVVIVNSTRSSEGPNGPPLPPLKLAADGFIASPRDLLSGKGPASAPNDSVKSGAWARPSAS